MRSPAALPALCLWAGVSAGVFLPLDLPALYFVLIGSLIGAALAFAGVWSRAVAVTLTLGFLGGGAALGAHAHDAALSTPLGLLFTRHSLSGQHELFAVVKGRIREDPSPTASGVSLSVAVDQLAIEGVPHAVAGGVILGVAGTVGSEGVTDWRAGRSVRFPATLRRASRYLDLGVPNGERTLAWRGTALVGSVKSPVLVEVISGGSMISEAAAAARAMVRNAIATSVAPFDPRSAAVVSAIVIGDRAGLDDELERRLQEAGTYHVIAISGGNIAILAAICLGVFRIVCLGPRLRALLTILLLSGYALIVGGGSSVNRATLMAVTYLVARLWDHRTSPVNGIAVAGAVVLCATPLAIVDVGFVLTFGASLAIVIGTPVLLKTAGGAWWLRAPLALLAASICAETALLPVSAFVFSRVTFAGLLLNFAAIPLMTIVQTAGLISVGLSLVGGPGASAAGYAAHLGVRGLLESATLVDFAPWLRWRVPPPQAAVMALYYTGLVGSLAAHARISLLPRQKGRAETIRAVGVVVTGLAGLWMVTAPWLIGSIPSPRTLRAAFLDVGQGDAVLVRFPNGRTLMVDTGGIAGTTFDIGSRVVAPALWALGTRRLDYLAVTHGDPDHLGGAAALVRDFRPLEIWEGVPVARHEPLSALRALSGRVGSAWRTLQRGDGVVIGGVQVRVRHPPLPDWERQRVRNDDSLVLEMELGQVSFVLTGDIGSEVEQGLIPGFSPAGLRVLKVPHHGSATSSSAAFVRGLRPAVAVISAGRGNRYGHPVPAVVERYRTAGAAIFRTDQDGAVMMETDGKMLKVRTYTGRRLTVSAMSMSDER